MALAPGASSGRVTCKCAPVWKGRDSVCVLEIFRGKKQQKKDTRRKISVFVCWETPEKKAESDNFAVWTIFFNSRKNGALKKAHNNEVPAAAELFFFRENFSTTTVMKTGFFPYFTGKSLHQSR